MTYLIMGQHLPRLGKYSPDSPTFANLFWSDSIHSPTFANLFSRTRYIRRHSPTCFGRTRYICRHSPKGFFEKNVTRLDTFARVIRHWGEWPLLSFIPYICKKILATLGNTDVEQAPFYNFNWFQCTNSII
jgi:hypothetical protein